MAIKFERSPAGVWTPQRTAMVKNNLLGAFTAASPQERALGNRFYPDWQEDAQFLADKAGVSVEHGAAMLARLSPQTEAEMNRMMGYQLLSIHDKQAQHIHESAALYREAMRAPKGSDQRHELSAASAEARARAGIGGSPLNLQSSANISEALRHRNGESTDPMSTLGDVKINDFGHAILDPRYPRQVVDTHYHDAAVNRTDIPYDYNRGLGAKGRYENFSHAAELAYQTAAKRGLLDPSVTPPNGFMGGVWYRQQQHKVNTNPAALKARRASESRIRNFLGASGSAAWDPAAFGMRPAMSHTDTSPPGVKRRPAEEEMPTGQDRMKAEAKAAAINRALRKKGRPMTASELGNQPYEGWA